MKSSIDGLAARMPDTPINEAVMPSGAPSDRRLLTAVTEELRELLSMDPAKAEYKARIILGDNSRHLTAMITLAAALRLQGKAAEAQTLLEPIVRALPNYAGALYELGLVHADLGNASKSLPLLARAVDMTPERTDIWFALVEVWTALHFGAPPESLDHSLRSTEELARTVLSRDASDPEALDLLAQIQFWRNDLEGAEKNLTLCLQHGPELQPPRFRYAALLFSQNRFAETLPHLDQLLKRHPTDVVLRTMRANSLARTRQYGDAALEFAGLARECPDRAGLWLGYGRTLRALQRLEEAAAAFEVVIKLMPSLAEGYWNLASIKPYRFRGSQIVAMRTQAARTDLSPVTRAHLQFALGKALEDEKRFADSFAHYKNFHDLLRPQFPYSAEEHAAFVRRAKNTFTQDAFDARAGQGCASHAPIFIVGMPRSGSTLVEQILASHSAIQGLGELPHIPMLISLFEAKEYPESLLSLRPRELQAFGEEYLALGRSAGTNIGALFTDKLPLNCDHIGFIQLILPRARIVDVRRHPLDCGLSCFKSYFPLGVPFSHCLTDIGHFYRDYVELIAHFDAVLPRKIHRIIYEDLIADPETEIRRLLSFLELPFEPECLRFYETQRVVTTLSSEQVRRPVYTDSIGYWKNYELWLGPLKSALGDILDSYPTVPEITASMQIHSLKIT